MSGARIWRSSGPVSSDTFHCPVIGEFVRRYLGGVGVDPFARDSQLVEHTNDLDPLTSASSHLDAVVFLDRLAARGVVADLVILDPPYSPRQISDCYRGVGRDVSAMDTQNASLYARVRRSVRQLVRPGSVVLSFGWNSTGMGPGFELLELLLVSHGSAHNDTICMAERAVAFQMDLVGVAA